MLRFLGDPSRAALLLLLAERPSGFTVGEIADALAITHSATSHQLAGLEERGIIEGFREGQAVRYRLAKSSVARGALALLRAAARLK